MAIPSRRQATPGSSLFGGFAISIATRGVGLLDDPASKLHAAGSGTDVTRAGK